LHGFLVLNKCNLVSIAKAKKYFFLISANSSKRSLSEEEVGSKTEGSKVSVVVGLVEVPGPVPLGKKREEKRIDK
jgi:hypothetical protein